MENISARGISTVIIRHFNKIDYPGIAAVDKIVSPSYAIPAEGLHHHDVNQDPAELWDRFVAVDETGQIIGTARYSGLLKYCGGDNTFSIFVNVLPSYLGQGIGASLFNAVIDSLQPYQPYNLFSNILADDARTVRFLRDRGFADYAWEHASKIDLTVFEPAQFDADLQQVADQGIALKTILELAANLDRNQKLFDLSWAIENGDTPNTEGDKPSLEQWCHWLAPDSGYLFDTCIIACDGDKYVGTTGLEIYDGTELGTGLTGVLSDYRRRGIATAIKVKSLSAAKSKGYTAAYTWSNSTNHGMIDINLRLGFVEQPAWILMKKAVAAYD